MPDFVAVHGKLRKGKRGVDIADDATLAATFRMGQPFKGKPAFEWSINGEKGEILVTGPDGLYLHTTTFGQPIKIEMHDHVTDEVQVIEWDWKDWQKEWPERCKMVAEVYERYARWYENGKPDDVSDEQDWPRLNDSLGRMKEFDTLWQQYDSRTGNAGPT